MTRVIARAVPERQEFISYVSGHLPETEWCMDRFRDAMETFLRAMAMAGQDAVLHMEEDVILTRGFRTKVEMEIAARPEHGHSILLHAPSRPDSGEPAR